MTIAVLFYIVALCWISEFIKIELKFPIDFVAVMSEFMTIEFRNPQEFNAVYEWCVRVAMMAKFNWSFYTGFCFDDAVYGSPWIFAFNDGDRCNLLWQCCIPPIAADVDEFFKY